jgi:hypothetical protein
MKNDFMIIPLHQAHVPPSITQCYRLQICRGLLDILSLRPLNPEGDGRKQTERHHAKILATN